MDSFHGEVSRTTFGPEWLTLPKDPQFHFSEENYNHHVISKPPRPPAKRLPLRYTRSKSTPLLTASDEHANQSDEDDEDIEGNRREDTSSTSFDLNFPSLNAMPRLSNGVAPLSATTTPSPPTNPTKSTGPQNVWKIQSKPVPVATQAINGSSPTGGSPVPDSNIQLASCLVPTVQPPKVLTRHRVELLTKKGPILNNKKKFDISPLRKATSDPSLPIPQAYQENYSKLMVAKKEKEKQLKVDKPKSGTVMLNRNEFFKGLARKDSSGSDSESNSKQSVKGTDENGVSSPSGEDFNSSQAEEHPDVGSGLTDDHAFVEEHPRETFVTFALDEPLSISRRYSRDNYVKPIPVEDEERFLRDLGWVPEEEAHVPELTPEEIRESARQVQRWMTQHLSADKKRFQALQQICVMQLDCN